MSTSNTMGAIPLIGVVFAIVFGMNIGTSLSSILLCVLSVLIIAYSVKTLLANGSNT